MTDNDPVKGADGRTEVKAAAGGRLRPVELVLLAILAVELVLLYWRAGHELYVNWTLVDSYYSHGFLVPFVSAFFIWRERSAILAAPRCSSASGFAWIAGASVMLLLGDFLGFRVFGHLSIVPMLTGISLILQGKARTFRMWFPIAFLLFMIPIPPSLTQSIALRLKLVAAECSVRLARMVTIPMVRQGSYVHFGDDYLLIGDVCGGLRSLIALLALGALMAYISQTRSWARWLVLFLSGPIAVVSNVFRIFLLCVVGYFYGSEVAGGTVHDVSGYLIFAVAIALFISLESALRWFAPAREESVEGAPRRELKPAHASPWHRGTLLALVALVTAAHLAILGGQARAARNAIAMTDFDIPAQIVDYRQAGVDLEVEDHVREVLGTSSILIRTYVSPRGRPLSLTVVYAGTTRRSLHFPEVCLVGEGFEVLQQEMAPVGFMFTAKRLVLSRGKGQEAVLYWFKTGDNLTGNYFLNAYYWAKNQLSFSTPTSSMIRLSTPVGPGGAESAFATLDDFATKFTPILLDKVD
ncbi:MAG: EpsI family protein [bacterium]|nr:EpsI family protein [bacterium]